MADGDCATIAYLLRRYAPRFDPRVVFDVGANVGQFSLSFHDYYPDATIYAFEPTAEPFSILQSAAAGRGRIEPVKLALGHLDADVTMEINDVSAMSRVVARAEAASRTERVRSERGESFCRRSGVEHIDYLKVDTEGYDLNVLSGFTSLIDAQAVDFIEVEVGMNRRNSLHVPLEAIRCFLEPKGYSLFHIFEQFMDIPFSGRPVLRRCNTMFISDVAADRQGEKA